MSATEIIRRLSKLINMAPAKRPLPIKMLERVAGLSYGTAYEVVRVGRMREQTRLRFERALKLLENDQIRSEHTGMDRTHGRKIRVTIVAAKPKHIIISRVTFGPKGPTIERLLINPNALPDLKRADE